MRITARIATVSLVVIAGVVSSVLFLPNDSTVGRIIATIIAALVGTALIAAYVEKTVTKPVRRILKFAEALARRDFSSAPVSATGELGDLAVTLKQLGVKSEVVETMRRDFVANVSHELKTPLTVIAGFAETLAETDLPADSRIQFAESISRHANRMRRIVDDLLDLSRIESGAWTPTIESVDFVQLGNEIRDELTTAIPPNVSLIITAGQDAEMVEADKTALRQVLTNLFENALRHTTAGKVAVTSANSDGMQDIAVADTGSGIAEEHLPRIFERFYRIDTGRTRDRGGTGLGLAIVKHLAEAHRGSVHADSVVGQGTTITVRLPRSSTR